MSDKYNFDPRQQFSKKLAGRTEWFWFIYLLLLLVLIAYQPGAAMTTVYLAVIVTIVMIVNVWAYTKNSIYQKGLEAAKEMAKLKFSWKHNGTEMVSADDIVPIVEVSEDKPEDESEEGDETNG